MNKEVEVSCVRVVDLTIYHRLSKGGSRIRVGAGLDHQNWRDLNT